MKKIIIRKEIEMTAQGTRTNGNCQPTLKIKGKNKDGISECWVPYDSLAEAGEANGLEEATISYHCSAKKWSKISAMDILTKDRPFYCKIDDVPHLLDKLSPFIQLMYADHLVMEEQRKEDERKAEEMRQEKIRMERELREKEKALADLQKYNDTLVALYDKIESLKAKQQEQYSKCIDIGALAM